MRCGPNLLNNYPKCQAPGFNGEVKFFELSVQRENIIA